MASSVRVAAVGCGFFATNHFHAWNDLGPEGAELVAVCDIDAKKAEAAAKKFGVPKWYTDFDEMLAKEKIDLLDVITRMDTHRMLVEKSIGKKIAMAVSGLVLVGFLISHVISNLTVLWEPQHLDDYAAWLRSFGPLLWVARIGLIAFAVVHITAAWQLTQMARRARPEPYERREARVGQAFVDRVNCGGHGGVVHGFAPASNQALIVARSVSVICVALPSGIVFATTVCW